jgi:hypothetical protein
MNDWDDRALDAALQEVHGSKPPDLSARVLLALQERQPLPLPTLVNPRRSQSWTRLAALLCAAMALGFGAAWSAAHLLVPARLSNSGHDAVAIDVAVLAGEVAWRSQPGAVANYVGDNGVLAIEPARGGRLWCHRPAAFRLGTFGLLTATAQTELELQDMTMDRKHGVVAISSLTLGVVTGAFSWQALTRGEVASAGESVTLRAGGVEAPAAALAAENRELKARLEQLERDNQRLVAAAIEREAAPRAPAATEVAPAAAAAPPEIAAAMTFADPRYAALAKLDWAAMGAASNEMGPLLAQFVEAMQKEGAELPMDLVVKIQQLNTKLVEQVPAMLAAGLPGFGANGSYTHPLVVGNTMASTLGAAGQSLSPAQQQQMDGLVRAFSAEAQSIADSTHELAIDHLLVETEMKDRFFREVGTSLTPEQAKVLQAGAAGYDGSSLFSTGVTIRHHAQAIEAKDAAEFSRTVGRDLSGQLGLDDAQEQQLRSIIARGAAAPELWAERAMPAERSQGHFLRTERTRAALRQQAAWMRQIQREMNLTPEQRSKLGKMSKVMVPLPR